jgi:Ca2+-binding EF-hand superfamily protein
MKVFIMEGLQGIFAVCDPNQSGGCSYREFMNTLKDIAIEPLFNFMDRDSTGDISTDDMKFLDLMVGKGTADMVVNFCSGKKRPLHCQ